LSGTQFSTLNTAGINAPEGPAKYKPNIEEELRKNRKQNLLM
jgi:hypothetical protein